MNSSEKTIDLNVSPPAKDPVSVVLRSLSNPKYSAQEIADLVLKALVKNNDDASSSSKSLHHLIWRELFVTGRFDVIDYLRRHNVEPNPLARYNEQSDDVKKMVPPIEMEKMNLPVGQSGDVWVEKARQFIVQTNFKSAFGALHEAQKTGSSFQDFKDILGEKPFSLLVFYVADQLASRRAKTMNDNDRKMIGDWASSSVDFFNHFSNVIENAIEREERDFGSWAPQEEKDRLASLKAMLEQWRLTLSVKDDLEEKTKSDLKMRKI